MRDYPRPLLLFDGGCALCNGTVRWLLRRDRQGRLHYAPLASDLGRRLLLEHGLPAESDTVVLIDEQGAHRRSESVWRVLRLLPWPWRALSVVRVIPRFLRDAVYRFIARIRFRVFGRSDICKLQSSVAPEKRRRILEEAPSPG